MLKKRIDKNGVALFMVLATILIVVVLANVALTIVSNQGRLTRHEVGRIQAYYSAQAGLQYTMAKIRVGIWPSSGVAERYYCFATVPAGAGQCITGALTNTIPYDEGVTSRGAYRIEVEVCRDSGGPASCTSGPATPAGTIRLNAKVDYTYQ